MLLQHSPYFAHVHIDLGHGFRTSFFRTAQDIQTFSTWNPDNQDVQLNDEGKIVLTEKQASPLDLDKTLSAAKRIAECVNQLDACQRFSFKFLNEFFYEPAKLTDLRSHVEGLQIISSLWTKTSKKLEEYCNAVAANEIYHQQGLGALRQLFKTIDGSSSLKNALETFQHYGILVKEIDLNPNAGRTPTKPIVEVRMSGLSLNSKIVSQSFYFLTFLNHSNYLSSEQKDSLYKVLKVTQYKNLIPEDISLGNSKKIVQIPRGTEDTCLEIIFSSCNNMHELMQREAEKIANQLITESNPAYVILPIDSEEKLRSEAMLNENPLYRSKSSLFV